MRLGHWSVKESGCSNDAIIKAIRYAVDNGAKIINMSLSTWATTGYSTVYESAVKYARDHRVIIVAAAGNGDVEGGIGQDLNIIPQSPVCNGATSDAVIGVGAVTADNYLTAWSNYGTNCVDAYAPGVGIVTTAVPAYSTLGGFYDSGDGTSFAAPIITGIVSLLVQKYPRISPNEVVTRLWRDQDGGVINALKVLADTYVPYGQKDNFPFIVTGTKSGGGPEVRVLTPVGKLLTRFNAYNSDFRGGVNVAVGDVNGDGLPEIVTSTRVGGIPTIKVFDVQGTNLHLEFNVYEASYRKGINIAVGDIDNDGLAEIVTGIVSAGGPHVRIFGINSKKVLGLLSNGFMAFDPAFRGGLAVTTLDINNDGKDEIITGVGGNSNPTIRIFNKDGKQVSKEFNAYDVKYKNGLTLSAGIY